ncbi:hydantoinase/oxoprolinase N-terminal domain-containing protein [Oricola indica]|uniref:hydantoinase/oxoprolinase N-terminal domain-containing protein n=1 Tax=Oricola indica TaxID=2872591 RepID=UPI003D178BEB
MRTQGSNCPARISTPKSTELKTAEIIWDMLRIGVDIGGTFTDFCGWREGSQDIVSLKVPSTPPSF